MSEIGLGRRTPPDRSHDHAYLLPVRELSSLAVRRVWNSVGVLDQDGTAQCVAYAGYKYLTTGPVINRHPKQQPADIYRDCLKVDEFPGEDWEGGTSVRALFNVFRTLGYVSGYEWAFDAERVVGQILAKGPVVVGTSWFNDMFMPHNKTGYLSVTGKIEGGHAWLLIGADREKKNPDKTQGAVRMINSWGPSWGQKGRAWVTFQDLDRLLKADGEACVATEVKISALESGTMPT